MSTTPAKPAVKPKTGKLPKAEAEKAPAAKPEAKKTAAKKEATGGKIKVTQTGGSIARKWDQEATLIGLGLNKRHRSRVLEDTPAVRGMINKVQHLVKVEKA